MTERALTSTDCQSWPEDFRVLLQQYADELFGAEDLCGLSPAQVVLTSRQVEPFFSQLDPECRRWHTDDWSTVIDLVVALDRGATLPPLIADDAGQLLDGYHRLFALRHLYVAEYPFIVLKTGAKAEARRAADTTKGAACPPATKKSRLQLT